MRKLFNEFFYIPKHGKVREKVMLTHLTMTITIVIVCLAAMSITAYAYFSYNVTSASNIIKAANFEANVSINGQAVTTTKSGKLQTVNLEEAGIYTVELTKGESTAQTGFCIISIGDTDYYTAQIGVDTKRGEPNASVKFTLNVPSATKIEILSHWGTSSCYGYEEASDNPIYIKSKNFEIDLTNSTVSNDETPSTEGQGTAENTTSTEATTETQPVEETTGAPTTEANS